MDYWKLAAELDKALQAVPILDAHTHLVGGRLGARGLHDILLYHMVISDLYAAGCPDGARLTQFPGEPADDEAHRRLKAAAPYIGRIQNTSCFWGVRIILKDLFGWNEPVTERNWERLDALIRERARDTAWPRRVMRKANIPRFCTEFVRRGNGADDDILDFSLEWAFFTRCQWGEYDTALYELERCWGRSPESPSPIGGERPPTARVIRSLKDVYAAIGHYVSHIPYDRVISMATHFSTDIDLRPVSDREMIAALKKRAAAGPAERNIYAAYINEALLTALAPHADTLVFAFSLAAEPLPHETASRIAQGTLAQLAALISRHPKIRFHCCVASRHANQTLCTFCRELPNFSLGGYWWHNFFPDAIRQIMEERLDMLPVNKQVGFFSDSYCVEWAYAKAVMVRRQLAQVLAQKILQGQYTRGEALVIARTIFYETPQTLLRMRPVETGCTKP